MKKITINLSFFNQYETLKKQVLGWSKWPEDLLRKYSFCIVDDSSKIKATDVLLPIDYSKIDLSIYRVKEDLYCNIAGVRNLAAQECKTEWMVILDMDTIISQKLASEMINLINISPKNCFKFNRKVINNRFHNKNGKIHPAVCLLRKKDYWFVGGCEEDLVGHYGQTDPIFWYRAKDKLKVHIKTNMYLEYEPMGEADIQRDIKYNSELFEKKKKAKNWSKDFIRFEWEKIY